MSIVRSRATRKPCHRATRISKDILILDCPFAALDVITAQTVMEGMLRLTSDKCTLLCTMSSSLVADIWEGFLGKNCDLHPRFHQNSWPFLKSGVSEKLLLCPKFISKKNRKWNIMENIRRYLCNWKFSPKTIPFLQCFRQLAYASFFWEGKGVDLQEDLGGWNDLSFMPGCELPGICTFCPTFRKCLGENQPEEL